MNAHDNNMAVAADRALHDEQDIKKRTVLGPLSVKEQRTACIQEYEEMALALVDTRPGDALICMGTASLQRIFEHISKVVLEEFEDGPPTIDTVRDLAPEIRLLVRLRNAVEFDREFVGSGTVTTLRIDGPRPGATSQ